MIVHGDTPDCRHLTDKPARLDLTAFFYIAAVQLGTRFRTWTAQRANLSQPDDSIPSTAVNKDFQTRAKPHLRHCKLDAARRLRRRKKTDDEFSRSNARHLPDTTAQEESRLKSRFDAEA
jgi:hypothetical protein